MQRVGAHLVDGVRRVLADRLFSDRQIDKILPHLQVDYFRKPAYLSEIIDTWNSIMSKQAGPVEGREADSVIPAVAKPTSTFLIKEDHIDMNHVLADVEPRLLLLDPPKLLDRHSRIQSLNIAHSINDHWLLLLHAPRGLYLQEWSELMRKFLYIQDNIFDFLIDKKKQKDMERNPLLRSAAVTEVEFDHIRTRYLFAQRVGYLSLAHLYPVKMALNEPNLHDLLLSSDRDYLKIFAPFCTVEEYSAFANLIKNHELDQEDMEIVNRVAELSAL